MIPAVSARDIVVHQKELQQVYRKLLNEFGIPGVKTLQVSAFMAMGVFVTDTVAPGTVNQVMSPGNKNKVYTLGVDTLKEQSVYHGSWYALSWINSLTGGTGGTYELYLSTGPNSALASFMVQSRPSLTANDGLVNAPNVGVYAPGAASADGFMHKFDNIIFSYVKQSVTQSAAGSIQGACRWIFTGLQIQYTGN